MSDAESESFVADAVDKQRFARLIRKSVYEVVEGTLAKVPGNADTRQDIRAAGERLGTALVAHAEAAKPPDTASGLQASTAMAGGPPTLEDSDERARAFRAMAGVRQ